MAPGRGRRSSPESKDDSFDGRDLLVGRPEGAVEDRPAAEAADVPPATPTPQPAEPSPQPDTHDNAIAEILATVRATAFRIDALQDATLRAPLPASPASQESRPIRPQIRVPSRQTGAEVRHHSIAPTKEWLIHDAQ